MMSIRSTVLSEIQEIARGNGIDPPALTDDLPLMDSGLDSLALAVLVARLEETLGLDPFTESDDIFYPVTLGDFIRCYENSAKSRTVDSEQPG